jgi:transcriptional regulator with XRE-family HTH domain
MKLDKQSQLFLKRLGMRLREIRVKKGWTLEETEEHGWPSWRHLQKIEAGKNVTIISLWRISKVYKVALNQILNGLD